MPVIAILGAGPIGAAVAHALAQGGRFSEIRLVDAAAAVAQGKALDIRQSGPIDGFNTALTGHADMLAAADAAAVVVADTVEGGEWNGETGLALVRQVARSGATAPVVFAGPAQAWLMEAAVREAGVPRDRVVGSAAAAVASAARALVALELDGSATDLALTVVGRPGAFVLAWSSATVAGSALADHLPAHRMLAVGDRLAKLGSPGPQAIGAATSPIVQGLVFGTRRRVPGLCVLDGEYGARGRAAMLPLALGNGRILRRILPSLSTQERVQFMNGLEQR